MVRPQCEYIRALIAELVMDSASLSNPETLIFADGTVDRPRTAESALPPALTILPQTVAVRPDRDTRDTEYSADATRRLRCGERA
jgi:hypothetical protein